MEQTNVVLTKDVNIDEIFDSENLLVSDRLYLPIGAHTATYQPNEAGGLPIKVLTRQDGKKLYLLQINVTIFGTNDDVKGECAVNSKVAIKELQENLKAGKKTIHVRAKHSNTDGECYTSLITEKQAKIMYSKQSAVTTSNVLTFADLSEADKEKFLDSLSRKEAKEFEENPSKIIPSDFELTA